MWYRFSQLGGITSWPAPAGGKIVDGSEIAVPTKSLTGTGLADSYLQLKALPIWEVNNPNPPKVSASPIYPGSKDFTYSFTRLDGSVFTSRFKSKVDEELKKELHYFVFQGKSFKDLQTAKLAKQNFIDKNVPTNIQSMEQNEQDINQAENDLIWNEYLTDKLSEVITILLFVLPFYGLGKLAPFLGSAWNRVKTLLPKTDKSRAVIQKIEKIPAATGVTVGVGMTALTAKHHLNDIVSAKLNQSKTNLINLKQNMPSEGEKPERIRDIIKKNRTVAGAALDALMTVITIAMSFVPVLAPLELPLFLIYTMFGNEEALNLYALEGEGVKPGQLDFAAILEAEMNEPTGPTGFNDILKEYPGTEKIMKLLESTEFSSLFRARNTGKQPLALGFSLMDQFLAQKLEKRDPYWTWKNSQHDPRNWAIRHWLRQWINTQELWRKQNLKSQ